MFLGWEGTSGDREHFGDWRALHSIWWQKKLAPERLHLPPAWCSSMSPLLLLRGDLHVSRQAQDGLSHISSVQKTQGNGPISPNLREDTFNVLTQR